LKGQSSAHAGGFGSAGHSGQATEEGKRAQRRAASQDFASPCIDHVLDMSVGGTVARRFVAVAEHDGVIIVSHDAAPWVIDGTVTLGAMCDSLMTARSTADKRFA